jgi:hypothetical protein
MREVGFSGPTVAAEASLRSAGSAEPAENGRRFPVEHYLGDGLFVSFDGFAVKLRAPRLPEDHWVALEPAVLAEFLDFVEAHRMRPAVEAPERIAPPDDSAGPR